MLPFNQSLGNVMPKIPDCDRCLFYSHSEYLVCQVHPYGVQGDRCLDFRPAPNAEEEEEQWAPEGYTWYGGELIPNRPPRYTKQEQLEILDNPPLVHWDCPACGWVDDSV